MLLAHEFAAVAQLDSYLGGHFVRVALGVGIQHLEGFLADLRLGVDLDLLEQVLNVLPLDALRQVLAGSDLSVQDGDGYYVG